MSIKICKFIIDSFPYNLTESSKKYFSSKTRTGKLLPRLNLNPPNQPKKKQRTNYFTRIIFFASL
jgi:hypothetical protein